jgi:hypothetical protein
MEKKETNITKNKKEAESRREVPKKYSGQRTIKEQAQIVLDFFKKTFQKKEEKIFQERFGARDYIETYYPVIENVAASLETFKEVQTAIKNKPGRFDMREIMETKHLKGEEVENIFIFDFQRNVSKELLKAFPADHIRTLDVGGGPTVYQHIFTAMVAGDITHSEFLEQNRQEVSNWVQGLSGGYNWDSYFELIKNIIKDDDNYIKIIENNLDSLDVSIREHALMIHSLLYGDTSDGIKKNLQKVIGDKIIFGDVFKQNLGIEDDKNSYEFVNSATRESAIELVTSNFTIESATSDKDKWRDGMRHIMDQVKIHGYLAISAIRNSSWYKVGGERMPAVAINEAELADVLTTNGFKILDQRVLEGSSKEDDGYDGMIFIFAQKN